MGPAPSSNSSSTNQAPVAPAASQQQAGQSPGLGGPFRRQRRTLPGLNFLRLAVVALILLALLWWLSRSIGGSKQPTGVPAGETLTAEEMKSLDEAATENANFKKRQIRLAKIHARQEAIAARVDRSLTLLTELEAARQKWEAEVKELPTNSLGRFIASRDEAVSAFVRERAVQHVSAREIETTKQGLQNLLKPIDEARADQESILEVDLATTKELAEAHQWIATSLTAYQKSINLIEGLIVEGQKGTASRWTLQEAIEKQNAFQGTHNGSC